MIIDVVTDSEGNAALRAGRYITDNVYLGVEAGAKGTTKGTINLDITENLKARGGAGLGRRFKPRRVLRKGLLRLGLLISRHDSLQMVVFCASVAHVPERTLRYGSRNPPF